MDPIRANFIADRISNFFTKQTKRAAEEVATYPKLAESLTEVPKVTDHVLVPSATEKLGIGPAPDFPVTEGAGIITASGAPGEEQVVGGLLSDTPIPG